MLRYTASRFSGITSSSFIALFTERASNSLADEALVFCSVQSIEPHFHPSDLQSDCILYIPYEIYPSSNAISEIRPPSSYDFHFPSWRSSQIGQEPGQLPVSLKLSHRFHTTGFPCFYSHNRMGFPCLWPLSYFQALLLHLPGSPYQ